MVTRLARRAVLPACLVFMAAGSEARDAQPQGGSRTLSAMDLARLSDLEGLSVSPDGERVAFQVRSADPVANRYDMAWYVAPTRGSGPVRRIADAGEPILLAYMGRYTGAITTQPAAWSPDSKWIAYLRRDGHSVQAWRSSLDGEETARLTDEKSDVRKLVYARDGRRLLLEVEPGRAQIDSALSEEGRTGYLYDSRFFPAYSVSPTLPADASLADRGRMYSPGQIASRQILAYEFEARRIRPATDEERSQFTALTSVPRPNDGPASGYFASASPAGAIAWTAARDPQQQGGMAPLTVVAQSGRSDPIVCGAPQCVGQMFHGVWWNGESEVVFARAEGPYFRDTGIYAWMPRTGVLREVLRTPDTLMSAYEWTCALALNRLVCFLEWPDRPRRLVALKLDTGAIDMLHDPNPEFGRFDLGRTPERLGFHTASGVRAYGYLVLPPAHERDRRLPLVIVTYRCPGFLRGGVGDEYPVYPLAAQGLAVLCVNTPDTDHERLGWMEWNAHANWRRGPGDPAKRRVQEALDVAVKQLDEAGIIDADRVGLTGLSFGGETVAYALFNMPRLAAASASGLGFEPADIFLYGPAGRARYRAWGLASADSGRWRDLSLSANARRVRTPLLLNVPDREMLPVLQPLTAIEEAGRAVEMHVFPDEYHIKWQPAHRLAIYHRNIDWMNFWLRGVEDSDPAKAEQYKRWRAMRVKQCELFKGEDAPWYCQP